MATPKLKGGTVGSIRQMKKSLKKSSGGQYLSRVPSESELIVRFLTEPTDWVEYSEHFDDIRKFYPCSDDCPGCELGERASKRYLANALNVEESKVIPLVLPVTAARDLLKKYDRYNTLMDRDYIIARTGSGLDTEYEVSPEGPLKRSLGKYDLLDLWSLLEKQLPGAEDDDEDEDEDEDKPPSRSSRRTAGSARRRPADDDDDEDDEEDAPPKRTTKKSAPKKVLRRRRL